MSLSLSGRVALVTGANHGIGAATARLFAQQGASVLLTFLRSRVGVGETERYQAQRMSDGELVAQEIRDSDGSALAMEADLSDVSVAPELFDAAEDWAGPIDILVNNATGHCACDSFGGRAAVGREHSLQVTADVFDKTFAIDARAAALLIAEFAERHTARRASWGRIVGLTSGSPMGFPGEVTYGAAKAALENYTMAASAELGAHGITANIVYPPVTDTGWVTDEVRQFVEQSNDHIHVAEPADVAGVIAFLCSDDARMVTGNVVRMR